MFCAMQLFRKYKSSNKTDAEQHDCILYISHSLLVRLTVCYMLIQHLECCDSWLTSVFIHFDRLRRHIDWKLWNAIQTKIQTILKQVWIFCRTHFYI